MTYYRGLFTPRTEEASFNADVDADYIIELDEGTRFGADAQVTLNGEVLLARRTDRRSPPRHVRRSVRLKDSNLLKVTLYGVPWTSLTVSVLGGVKTLGPDGGTVRLPGGRLELRVPAGALVSPVEIGIIEGGEPLPRTPAGMQSLGSVRLSPSGLSFLVPVTVAYQPSQVVADGPIAALHTSQDFSIVDIIPASSVGGVLSAEIQGFSGLFFLKDLERPDGSVLFGGKWVVKNVKWYAPSADNSSYLTPSRVAQAFALWQEQVRDLTFTQVSSPQQANIIFTEWGSTDLKGAQAPSCSGVIYLDEFNDGAGLVTPARTCFDFSAFWAESEWDEGETVQIQFSSGLFSNNRRAFKTIVHEIGHAIGVGHPHLGCASVSPAVCAIMHQTRYYPANQVSLRNDLHAIDISAAQALYGASGSPTDGPTLGREWTVCSGRQFANDDVNCAMIRIETTSLAAGGTKVVGLLSNLQGSGYSRVSTATSGVTNMLFTFSRGIVGIMPFRLVTTSVVAPAQRLGAAVTWGAYSNSDGSYLGIYSSPQQLVVGCQGAPPYIPDSNFIRTCGSGGNPGGWLRTEFNTSQILSSRDVSAIDLLFYNGNGGSDTCSRNCEIVSIRNY